MVSYFRKYYSNPKYMYATIFVLSIIIVITNFRYLSINTIFVLIIFLLTLLLPIKYGLALFPVIFVYFGFSFITARIAFVSSFNNNSFINLYYVILAIKILLKSNIQYFMKMPKLFLIFIIYTAFTNLYHFQIVATIEEFSLLVIVWYIISSYRNNTDDYKILVKSFIVTLITVFFYNYLDISNQQISDAHLSWSGIRFVGVRDPNNFSLWCNLCLCFTLLFDIFENRKIRASVSILLIIGAIITQSISGIVTLFAILIFSLFYHRKTKFTATLILLIPAVVILTYVFINPILDYLVSLRNVTITDYVTRISGIIKALSIGNYSEATTTRTWLWNYYLAHWQSLSIADKIIGNKYNIISIMNTGMLASHNSWIDILYNYGIIGIVVAFLNFVAAIIVNLKSKRYNGAFVNATFFINTLFRTLSGIILFFPIFF